MKCYFTVLLITLLIEMYLAEYNNNNCNANQEVNINLIRDSYLEGVKYVPVVNVESGKDTSALKEAYIKVALDYLQSLIVLLYKRAQKIGEELINTVEQLTWEFENCCESIKNIGHESDCLESTLKNLTDQFHQFLDLIPGNALIKRESLPDLPPQPAEIMPRTTKRTADEIFVHLCDILGGNLTSSVFRRYTAIIHLAGWSAARTEFDTLQTQFRNEILNRSVLKAYKLAVDKVFKSYCSRIAKYANTETWKSFKDASDRIIVIYDDYQKSIDDCNNCFHILDLLFISLNYCN